MAGAVQKFVIMTASRSGSTALVRTLRQHPDVACLGNPFFGQKEKQKYSRAFPDAAFDFRTYTDDPVGFVNALYEQGRARCRGFKIWPLYGMPETRVAIEALAGDTSVRKIVLHRDNELAVFSSWRMARAARKTLETTGQAATPKEIPFEEDEFHLHYKMRQEWFAWRDTLLGDDVLRIPYVGLMDTGLQKIAQDLRLSPFDFIAKTEKRNSDNILDRFIPEDHDRIKQVLADMGQMDWLAEVACKR